MLSAPHVTAFHELVSWCGWFLGVQVSACVFSAGQVKTGKWGEEEGQASVIAKE